MISSINSDYRAFRESLPPTIRFIYNNSNKLILISIVWFMLSIPVITIGPATLGAYTSILSIKYRNKIVVSDVLETVYTGFLPAVLFGLLPFIFGGITVLYLYQFINDYQIATEILALVSLYITVLIVLILIPTFVGLAEGQTTMTAITSGYRWTAAHPTLSLTTVFITAIIFLTTVLLTIGFVFTFPMFAFSLQIYIIEESGNEL